ncbi:MAG TPA: hypothetical protein VJ991_13365 [Balneolales bacterium]|nr:hypothetical protein [Balneolales bacterium]
MKKRSYLLPLLLLFLLVSCSSKISLIQNKTTKNVVLSSLRVHLNNFDRDQFYSGDYASLLLSLRTEEPNSADLNDVHRAFNKRQNNFVKQELDTTYTLFKNALKKYNWNLLPINSLKGKTEYDEYGYPKSDKVKPFNKQADAALKITIYLSTDDFQRNYTSPDDYQINYRPKMTMAIEMVDSGGNTIWKNQAYVNADKQIIIDENNIGSIRRLEIEQSPKLADMVRKALNKLLANNIKPAETTK